MGTTRAETTARGRIVLALLAVAVAVALLVAQHLKGRLPLIDGSGVVWHPTATFDPGTQTPTFSFTSGYRDVLSVSIVSQRTGRTVAVVRRGLRVTGDGRRTPTLFWTARGAAPGKYEVQVHFARLDRTVVVPSIVFVLR